MRRKDVAAPALAEFPGIGDGDVVSFPGDAPGQPMMAGLRQWLATSLGARLLAMLASLMTVSSLVFLVAFAWLYRAELAQERTFASQQISMLFQASLENAMVKRDLPGVRDILRRLGRQPAVHGVMLANPAGEIRFASHSRLLKKPVVKRELAACRGAACSGSWPPERPYSRFYEDPVLGTVLRTVKPIYNKPVCTPCHGPLETHPVNGVLIADFDARNLRTSAVLGAAGMAGAGAVITLLTLLAAWYFLRRSVLLPVRSLERASSRLAAGDLSARAPVSGRDELGRLGRGFNTMAEKVQELVERLRSHDAFLQSLIDAVPDGIRVIGPDYRIRLANRAYREQSGDGSAEVAGAFCYASAHGRDEPCPDSLVACPLEAVKRGRGGMKIMHTHSGPDGTDMPVEIVSAPLTDPATGERLVVEAIRDLSAQITVTQEQRMAELGQLATGVAHEIHNPLASVRLGLQAMIRAAERGRPREEIFAYLRQVDEAVDQCISVTGKLLRLSMPPAEHLQVVDIAEVVEDIVSLLRFEAERQRVEVRLDVDHGHRLLATDTEMRMVVLNMVQNAFHAMPEGGELRISTRRSGDVVLLTVSDTGVGMDPQTMEHIFEPFFSRRADRAEGTGLGLTICRAIVERYGGGIDVRSARNRGTTFTVTMPAAGAGGPGGEEEPAGREGGHGHGQKSAHRR